jgi:hypothetical protein
MKQKIIAPTLLIFYALTFNACSTKEYVTLPCSIKAPERLYNFTCKDVNDFEFAKCVLITKEALQTDYNNLLEAFNACF